MKSKDTISLYIEDCGFRNLAPNTIRVYQWALDRFVQWGEELPSTSSEVQKIIATRGSADDTLHDLWRASKTFYRWMERVHGGDNLMARVPPPSSLSEKHGSRVVWGYNRCSSAAWSR